MGRKTAIRRVGGMLAAVVICAIQPAGAASLLGGQTDNSVCDLGTAPQNSRKIYQASVPAGGYDAEVVRLARNFCRVADIQIRRTQADMGGLIMEIDEVRCTIGKLPK